MNRQKKITCTCALVAFVVTTGVTLQGRYDRYAAVRKETIQRCFFELMGHEPSAGSVTTIFFNTRKAKTLDEVREQTRKTVLKEK